MLSSRFAFIPAVRLQSGGERHLSELVRGLLTRYVTLLWRSWRAQVVRCGIPNSWCSIALALFDARQVSRLMLLLGTNTSPLGATRVTCGGTLQSALCLGNAASVCRQGVPTACSCRLMTHLGWSSERPAFSCLSPQKAMFSIAATK